MQALWMIVASLLFAFMGVCVKFGAAAFSSAEMIFYRGLISMLFMWGFARMQGVTLRTAYPLMHAWRSLVGVVALGAWFYAIAHLPLATATSVNYMSSVWIALFVVAGALMSWAPGRSGARAPVNAKLVVTVLAGFGGVVLLLRPELPANQLFAGLVAVLSSVAAAIAYLQVVALGRIGEPESRTVFYFAVGSAVGGALGMTMTGLSAWSWSASVWLVPIGVLAALGQWCMTRAYSDAHGEASTLVVANLQYSGILFSALLGYLVFDERIPLVAWLGIALIICSGIIATVIRVRSVPAAPGEEH